MHSSLCLSRCTLWDTTESPYRICEVHMFTCEMSNMWYTVYDYHVKLCFTCDAITHVSMWPPLHLHCKLCISTGPAAQTKLGCSVIFYPFWNWGQPFSISHNRTDTMLLGFGLLSINKQTVCILHVLSHKWPTCLCASHWWGHFGKPKYNPSVCSMHIGWIIVGACRG